MDEAEVKLLMSLCYRAGIKDGWDGKELPTLKQLDDTVNEIYQIYHNYTIAKQEQMAEEAAEEI